MWPAALRGGGAADPAAALSTAGIGLVRASAADAASLAKATAGMLGEGMCWLALAPCRPTRRAGAAPPGEGRGDEAAGEEPGGLVAWTVSPSSPGRGGAAGAAAGAAAGDASTAAAGVLAGVATAAAAAVAAEIRDQLAARAAPLAGAGRPRLDEAECRGGSVLVPLGSAGCSAALVVRCVPLTGGIVVSLRPGPGGLCVERASRLVAGLAASLRSTLPSVAARAATAAALEPPARGEASGHGWEHDWPTLPGPGRPGGHAGVLPWRDGGSDLGIAPAARAWLRHAGTAAVASVVASVAATVAAVARALPAIHDAVGAAELAGSLGPCTPLCAQLGDAEAAAALVSAGPVPRPPRASPLVRGGDRGASLTAAAALAASPSARAWPSLPVAPAELWHGMRADLVALRAGTGTASSSSSSSSSSLEEASAGPVSEEAATLAIVVSQARPASWDRVLVVDTPWQAKDRASGPDSEDPPLPARAVVTTCDVGEDWDGGARPGPGGAAPADATLVAPAPGVEAAIAASLDGGTEPRGLARLLRRPPTPDAASLRATADAILGCGTARPWLVVRVPMPGSECADAAAEHPRGAATAAAAVRLALAGLDPAAARHAAGVLVVPVALRDDAAAEGTEPAPRHPRAPPAPPAHDVRLRVSIVQRAESMGADTDGAAPPNPHVAAAGAAPAATAALATSAAAREATALRAITARLRAVEARHAGAGPADGGVAMTAAEEAEALASWLAPPRGWSVTWEPLPDGRRRPVLEGPAWAADCVSADDVASLIPTVAEFRCDPPATRPGTRHAVVSALAPSPGPGRALAPLLLQTAVCAAMATEAGLEVTAWRAGEWIEARLPAGDGDAARTARAAWGSDGVTVGGAPVPAPASCASVCGALLAALS